MNITIIIIIITIIIIVIIIITIVIINITSSSKKSSSSSSSYLSQYSMTITLQMLGACMWRSSYWLSLLNLPRMLL